MKNSYDVFWIRVKSLCLYLVLCINFEIETLTGCMYSYGTISGRDSSSLKVLVRGQNIYI